MKPVTSSSKNEDFLRELRSILIGSPISIERRESDWAFEFADRFVMGVGTLWRLVGATYICVASEDDGHQFGLPAPVDAAAKANGLLSERAVRAIEMDFRTGDLRFQFDGSLVLDIITSSSGYESWQMWRAGEFFAVGANGGLV